MGVKSPTITLLTGAALGAVLLVASMLATAQANTPSAPAPSPSPTATQDAGSPQASSSQTSSAPVKAATRTAYVAPVPGGGVAVAISVSGGRASAYVCKGSVIEARLRGPAAGGYLRLTGPDHARLRATYSMKKAAGYVLANGIRYPFSAPASRGSSAGPKSVRSRCEAESQAGTSSGAGQTGTGGTGGGGGGGGDDNGGGHGGSGHGGSGGGHGGDN
jgi:serine/threonine-protein kinase